jgi:hypothetical protein
VHVANERAFAAHDTGEAVARPEDIPEADVSYYSQPLRRLVGMHASFNELNGLLVRLSLAARGYPLPLKVLAGGAY